MKFFGILSQLICSFLIFSENVLSNSAVMIFESPQSVNVTLNMKVINMTCRVRAERLLYFINGKNGNLNSIAALGFNLGELVMITDGVLEQTVMITVSLFVDNSTVLCRAYNIDNSDTVVSDAAIILVQGPLQEPSDIEVVSDNPLHLLLSWTPPPTLLGTDILGYNITVNNESYTFTEDTQVHVNYSDFSPCDSLDIEISGYNGVDGEIATLPTQYIPSNIKSIPITYSVTSDRHVIDDIEKIYIQFSFNVSGLCDFEKPTSIRATVKTTEEVLHLREKFSLISNDSDEGILSSNGSILLNKDQKYCIDVEFFGSLPNATLHVYFDSEPSVVNGTTASPSPFNNNKGIRLRPFSIELLMSLTGLIQAGLCCLVGCT